MKKFILILFRQVTLPVLFFVMIAGVVNANSGSGLMFVKNDRPGENLLVRMEKFRKAVERLCGIHYVVPLPKGTGAKLEGVSLDWSYRHPGFSQNWATELCYLAGLARLILEAPQKPELMFLREKQSSLVDLTMLLIATVLDNDVTSIKYEYAEEYPIFAGADANDKIAKAILRLYAQNVTQDQCKQMTPETFPLD